MRTARFFVPEDWVARNAEAFSIPAGPLHKQITSVLRMKIGDDISLMTNDGTELDCRITEMNRSAVMGVIAGSKVPNPILPSITVCAACTKRDTFEWMLQKCTELGVSAIIPMVTDRAIKRPKENSARLHLIMKEASEQSGRVTLPTLYDPMTYGQALGHTDGMVRIVMHESAVGADASVGPRKVLWPKMHETSEVALFVGPEGGFTEEEVAAAKSAGAHVVTLGELVLRAETAAIVGVTKIRFS